MEEATMFLFLVCTFAMFTFPFLTFFGVRDVLQNEFGIVGFAATAWAVMASVLVVNLIIIFYVWKAYREETQDERIEGTAGITDKKDD